MRDFHQTTLRISDSIYLNQHEKHLRLTLKRAACNGTAQTRRFLRWQQIHLSAVVVVGFVAKTTMTMNGDHPHMYARIRIFRKKFTMSRGHQRRTHTRTHEERAANKVSSYSVKTTKSSARNARDDTDDTWCNKIPADRKVSSHLAVIV